MRRWPGSQLGVGGEVEWTTELAISSSDKTADVTATFRRPWVLRDLTGEQIELEAHYWQVDCLHPDGEFALMTSYGIRDGANGVLETIQAPLLLNGGVAVQRGSAPQFELSWESISCDREGAHEDVALRIHDTSGESWLIPPRTIVPIYLRGTKYCAMAQHSIVYPETAYCGGTWLTTFTEGFLEQVSQ
jgi:hypothetical protein